MGEAMNGGVVLQKRILGFANAIVFAVTLLGFTFNDYLRTTLRWNPDGRVIVGGSIGLALIYLAVDWSRSRLEREHSMREGSWYFRRFFLRWYRREGNLFVFCNDLDWLNGAKNQRLREALVAKASTGHLFLYLRVTNGDLAHELQNEGASVNQVPEHLMTRYRFSLRETDGLVSIIIRVKQAGNRRVVFRETNHLVDPYTVHLAQDFLSRATGSPDWGA